MSFGATRHSQTGKHRSNPPGCFAGRRLPVQLSACPARDAGTCHAHGCCWREVPLDSEQLRCFRVPRKQPQQAEQGANFFFRIYFELHRVVCVSANEECEVVSDDKVWCGFNDQTTCESNACCWEDDPGSPYCFEPLGVHSLTLLPPPECSRIILFQARWLPTNVWFRLRTKCRARRRPRATARRKVAAGRTTPDRHTASNHERVRALVPT